MLGGLLFGAVAGGGLLLVVRALVPSRPSLATEMARLGAARSTTRDGARDGAAGGWTALIRRLGGDLSSLERDLEILGRPVERHVIVKLVRAVGALLLPLVVVGALTIAGLSVPWSLGVFLGLGAGAIAYVSVDGDVRRRALERRREFRHALSAYLDLVVIVVAGGGGVESALHDAADVGNGWAFDEIRHTLATCRLSGQRPWDSLRALGQRLGVDELVELAASLNLAGEHGARIRNSLTAKAVSMREHRLADVQTRAEQATERMAVPTALMLFGFVGFVLFPALQFVLQG